MLPYIYIYIYVHVVKFGCAKIGWSAEHANMGGKTRCRAMILIGYRTHNMESSVIVGPKKVF